MVARLDKPDTSWISSALRPINPFRPEIDGWEEMERIYRGMIDKLIESDCYTPESFIPTYGVGLASLLGNDIKSIKKKLEEAIKDAECQL